MIIEYIDEYDTAIVKVDRRELGLILGKSFGDRYGNHGPAFSKNLIGVEYRLSHLRQVNDQLNILVEVRNKVASRLRDQADIIDNILWPIPEIGGENEQGTTDSR